MRLAPLALLLAGAALAAAGAAPHAAAAAAAAAAAGEGELPNPQVIEHTAPGSSRVVQTIPAGSIRRQADPPGMTTIQGPVDTWEIRRCSYPLNQIYYTEDAATKKLTNMWLGSYSYNSYAFAANTGGRNGPGTSGAACASPPKWGPAFDVASKCSLAPPPFAKGMVQLALHNVYYDRPGDSWGAATFVTGLKYYYAKTGGIERQEITVQYWSPTRGFLTSFIIPSGKNVTELTGKRAVAFNAPPGMVLAERVRTECALVDTNNPRAPVKTLARVTRACAIKPSWYPAARTFPSTKEATMYGYKCS